MREMMYPAGHSVASEEWLALRRFYFGQPETGTIFDDNQRPIPPEMAPYYCESCDHGFPHITLPTKCPLCGAEPGTQAVTVTHKGHVGRTFPFCFPPRLVAAPEIVYCINYANTSKRDLHRGE